MIDHLFIYGTLAPGRPNAHVMDGIPGTWQPAQTRGRLHAQGWGAAVGYPGIVVDATGPTVFGHLFSSPNLDEHWERLDTFEGEGYVRVRVSVMTNNGEKIEAWVYALADAPPCE